MNFNNVTITIFGLIDAQRKIHAIKTLRTLSSVYTRGQLGLREAKQACDDLLSGGTITLTVPCEQEELVKLACKGGNLQTSLGGSRQSLGSYHEDIPF